MPKILVISSEIHKTLAKEQLNLCLELVKSAGYDYQVEQLQAGVYEIPYVISAYQKAKPFDAYLALGLILKLDADHYETLMAHIRYSFTQFALNSIIVGNGIISGTSLEDLSEKLKSPNPCLSAYPSAFKAVECLLNLNLNF